MRIDAPSDGQTYFDPIVDVTGFAFVPQLTSLQGNGEQLSFGSDGAFTAQVELSIGRNDIAVIATDSTGRTFTSSVASTARRQR